MKRLVLACNINPLEDLSSSSIFEKFALGGMAASRDLMINDYLIRLNLGYQ